MSTKKQLLNHKKNIRNKESQYLHGYTQKEQSRLIYQAQFLSPWVHEDIPFTNVNHLLEVGCGVGAQTEILLKNFPNMQITGVDISEAQLSLARKRLKNYVKSGQLKLIQSDATNMSQLTDKYDGAFICWFLEHVPEPNKILKETYKKLVLHSPIVITEVQNHSLFVNPYSPTLLKYWFEFNDFQWTIKGHPYIGAQLGNLLKETKFKNIDVYPKHFLFDNRHKEQRKIFLDYWGDLLLSAAPLLLENHRCTKNEISQLKKEFEILKHDKNSVFYYSFMRALGRR